MHFEIPGGSLSCRSDVSIFLGCIIKCTKWRHYCGFINIDQSWTHYFFFFFFILAPLAIFAKSCLHLRPYALTSLCFLLQSPNFTIYNSEIFICIHYWIHKLCTWDAAVPTELIGTPVLSFKVSLSIQFIESWCICCFGSKKICQWRSLSSG